MRSLGYTASVTEGSNFMVSSTEADWGHVREGSLVSVGDDISTYQVAKLDSFRYIKDFSATKSDTHNITITENVGVFIVEGDTLDISYKEWELRTVFAIQDGGSGYRTGDFLGVVGGTAMEDSMYGMPKSIVLSVKSIDAKGGITEVECLTKGRYSSPPPERAEASGGSGNGAILHIHYVLTETRSTMERTAMSVSRSGGHTSVTLSYPIPFGVVEGKVSVVKERIWFTSPYIGQTKSGAQLRLIRDFTPHIGLALLAPGSQQHESIFNSNMALIDQKIKHLEDILASKGN